MRAARREEITGNLRATAKSVTLDELIALTGFSRNALMARWKRGQLSGPNRRGLWPVQKTRHELRKCPKLPVGRKMGRGAANVRLDKAATDDEQSIRHPQAPGAPVDTSELDPDTRYRLAKAQQEEIKLEKLRASVVEGDAVERRVFALFRLVRDRAQALPAKYAATMAARLRVDEGVLYRELAAMLHAHHAEMSKIDLRQALAQEIGEGDEVEEDEDAPEPPKKKLPKPPPSRPKKR